MLVAQNSLGPVCPVPLTVRGIALFQVEGKGTAQKIETDLQAYVKRLKYLLSVARLRLGFGQSKG